MTSGSDNYPLYTRGSRILAYLSRDPQRNRTKRSMVAFARIANQSRILSARITRWLASALPGEGYLLPARNFAEPGVSLIWKLPCRLFARRISSSSFSSSEETACSPGSAFLTRTRRVNNRWKSSIETRRGETRE